MMLTFSLVLCILPLLGVAGILMNGMITSVDGLFMSLILLILSGIFALDAVWDLRDRGLFGKKVAATPAAKSVAPKAS
jgi:hypothetical protein